MTDTDQPDARAYDEARERLRNYKSPLVKKLEAMTPEQRDAFWRESLEADIACGGAFCGKVSAKAKELMG